MRPFGKRQFVTQFPKNKTCFTSLSDQVTPFIYCRTLKTRAGGRSSVEERRLANREVPGSKPGDGTKSVKYPSSSDSPDWVVVSELAVAPSVAQKPILQGSAGIPHQQSWWSHKYGHRMECPLKRDAPGAPQLSRSEGHHATNQLPDPMKKGIRERLK